MHIKAKAFPPVLIARVVIAPVEDCEKRTSVGVKVLLHELPPPPPLVGHPLVAAARKIDRTVPLLPRRTQDGVLFEMQVTRETVTSNVKKTLRSLAIFRIADADPLPAPK